MSQIKDSYFYLFSYEPFMGYSLDLRRNPRNFEIIVVEENPNQGEHVTRGFMHQE